MRGHMHGLKKVINPPLPFRTVFDARAAATRASGLGCISLASLRRTLWVGGRDFFLCASIEEFVAVLYSILTEINFMVGLPR